MEYSVAVNEINVFYSRCSVSSERRSALSPLNAQCVPSECAAHMLTLFRSHLRVVLFRDFRLSRVHG